MEMNWFDINEDDATVSGSTNFQAFLTEDEINTLDNILHSPNKFFKKRENARSSLIKLIIENTYLYLNNMERSFNEDLEKILAKNYYKNIDSTFKKKLKENKREYNLIKELVRNQLLKTISINKETDTKRIKVQFRLAKDDSDLLKIISGNKTMTTPDFLSSYLEYFLSLPATTRRKILNYPRDLMIERAIKEERYLIIGDRKIKPYKIISTLTMKKDTLLGFDFTNHKLAAIKLSSLNEVKETNEFFEFTLTEKEILDSYLNLDTITASFVTINETKEIGKLMKDNSGIVKVSIDSPKVILTFPYSLGITQTLNRAFKGGDIKYLCYNEEYNTYVKMLKEYEEEEV